MSILENKFSQVALLFILFPFIGFRLNNLDIQPYAFVLAFFGVIYHSKLPKKMITLGFYALFSSFVAILSASSFESLARSAVTAFSPFVFAIFTYRILAAEIKLNRFLFCSIFIYFACGLFQYIYTISILDFIVVNRSTNDRGLTSLTPEPSMFGIYLILMYAAYLIANEDGRWKNIFVFSIVATQVLFMSQSSLAIIILIISSLFLFCSVSRKKNILLLSVISAASLMIFIELIDVGMEVRAFNVLTTLFVLDFQSLLIDSSIRDRYCHIALPLHGFFRDLGIPHGISNFNHDVIGVDLNSSCYFIHADDNSKIMSGLGQMIYENGVFAIPFIISIIFIVKNSLVVNHKKIFACTALILSQISSGTLALPLFGLIVGIFLYKAKFINDKNCT